MCQALTLKEIELLDCPTIAHEFSDDEIMQGVLSHLRRCMPNLDGTNTANLFVFAYARYTSRSPHDPAVFERADREYRSWVRNRQLPDYMGSFFKNFLKESVGQPA